MIDMGCNGCAGCCFSCSSGWSVCRGAGAACTALSRYPGGELARSLLRTHYLNHRLGVLVHVSMCLPLAERFKGLNLPHPDHIALDTIHFPRVVTGVEQPLTLSTCMVSLAVKCVQEQHWALQHEAMQSLLTYSRSPKSGDFRQILPRSLYDSGQLYRKPRATAVKCASYRLLLGCCHTTRRPCMQCS